MKLGLMPANRELIAKIINHSGYPDPVDANQIITIRIVGEVVWVQLFKCWVAFEQDWFNSQITEFEQQELLPV